MIIDSIGSLEDAKSPLASEPCPFGRAGSVVVEQREHLLREQQRVVDALVQQQRYQRRGQHGRPVEHILEEFEKVQSEENNPESAGFFSRVKDFFDSLGE